jgi:hypothetical protein
METASTIWQWNGSGSSRREKLKGLHLSTRMRDSRGAKFKIEVIEEGNEPNLFWKALGGRGEIKSAQQGGSDENFEKDLNASSKLYHISDASGQLEVNLISNAPFKQSMLNSDDCHILDICNEIFVWVGKGCTNQEKLQSMRLAEEFLKQDPNRPDWVPITRIVEGAETTIFKAQFKLWTETSINTESEEVWGGKLKSYDAYREQQKKIREENQNRKIDVATLIQSTNKE